MMALDGKTIIKEEITEKDAYDTQTATNATRRTKANSNTSSSSKDSNTTTTSTCSGNSGNSNSNSASGQNSSSSQAVNTTNGNRTPDSPESSRVVAPRSPMSPQMHHASLALAPPLPPARPNRNASASPVTSSPPPTSSASLAAAAAHVEQARLLGKIRKFLGSLVQIAQDVHPDVSERVRALVLSLGSGGINIDDFRLALQEAINLPLRPYVIPLLKQHITLLQREIVALARATNQTTLQYVSANENSVMEFTPHGPSAEYSDIFVQLDAASSAQANGGGSIVFKRRPSDNMMDHHNGLQEWSEYMTAAKRIHTAYQPAMGHSVVGQPTLFDYSASAGVAAVESGGYGASSHRDERDIRIATANEAQRHAARPVMASAAAVVNNACVREPPGGGAGAGGGGGGAAGCGAGSSAGGGSVGGIGSGGEEEWKNIHTMLNCISAMVDKTKRAITILQQRGIEPQQQNYGELTPAALVEIRRQTEEKVAEFKRNAEEAVNQVKRQAVIEIQRAVVAAESRTAEVMTQERLRMEKFFVEITRQSASEREIDNKSPSITAGAQNACWNCGRKATETCSGCNLARYCGAFCQHKDWEHHHQICGTTRTTDLSTKHAAQVIPLSANIRGSIAARSPPTPNAPPSHTQAAQAQSSSSGGAGGGGNGSQSSSLVPNGVGSK